MDHLQNKYNISPRHLLETSLHYCMRKVALAVPILDNKAVPNFYANFVKEKHIYMNMQHCFTASMNAYSISI